MLTTRRGILSLMLAAGLSGSLATMAGDARAEVSFEGERIELLVPYSAGGGTDIYARFLAPLLSERLPGKPTIIVNNVPGAGAIAGSNQFQKRAKPDGKSLIAVSASATLNFAFRDPRVQYKLNKWNAILSTPVGTVVYAHSKTGIKSFEEIAQLRDEELLMGANNATGGDLRALLSLGLLGIDVKPVFGMNRGDVYSSFERGEFNINFDTITAFETQVMPMVEQGIAVPLFSLGFVNDEGEYVRDLSHPEIPSYLEVYEKLNGKKLDGDAYKAWFSIFNLNVMASRAIMLPEGTPQEIVDTYNNAMRQLLADIEKDPALKEKAFEVLGPGPHAVGAAANRNLRSAVDFDDSAYAWLKQWLKEELDTKL